MEARDSVYDVRRANPFWTWKWFGFSNTYTMYNTGERSEQEKRDKNDLWTPLLPIKYRRKIQPLTNLSGGGGGTPPPLDLHMILVLR